ncbi:MAG TPA: valine--pyruvate transaminase [Gammaproteobacteria bacterium]
MSRPRFEFSAFGERFTRPTGALELMDDLGRALAGDGDVAFLGGGNPAKIPEVQALVRRRLLEAAEEPAALERMVSNYAHPAGDLPFRRALAKLLAREYGWALTEDHIALTAGSQASFFLLFNLFAGRTPDGGLRRLLLPMTPEYVGYADVGLDDGLIVSRRPVIDELSDRAFKYRVDFASLAIGPDVGAVCVSRPANPTGNVLADDELARLASLCAAAKVPLIVDGAYGMPFPGIVFGRAEPLWNEDVILCLSLSKLGLPGVRTGIVIADPVIVAALTNMTAVLNLAVGSVGPVLAEPWVESGEILTLGARTIMPYYRDKARRARDLVERELAGLPFRIHEPEGAFFLWLWLPGLPIPSAELYRRLKASGVLVLSGHYFFPGLDEPWPHRHECVRISYAQDDETVARGVRVLAREVRAAFDESEAGRAARRDRPSVRART